MLCLVPPTRNLNLYSGVLSGRVGDDALSICELKESLQQCAYVLRQSTAYVNHEHEWHNNKIVYKI